MARGTPQQSGSQSEVSADSKSSRSSRSTSQNTTSSDTPADSPSSASAGNAAGRRESRRTTPRQQPQPQGSSSPRPGNSGPDDITYEPTTEATDEDTTSSSAVSQHAPRRGPQRSSKGSRSHVSKESLWESESDTESESVEVSGSSTGQRGTPESESRSESGTTSEPEPTSEPESTNESDTTSGSESGTTSDNITLAQRQRARTEQQRQRQSQQQRAEAKQRQQQHRTVKLLVIEAFAGSFPVSRFIKQQLQQEAEGAAPGRTTFKAVAYAAIETEPVSGDMYKPPTAAEIGLVERDSLILQPRGVDERSVLRELVEFVNGRLADAACGVEAVVILGGPPCKPYTSVRSEVSQAWKKAVAEHKAAEASNQPLSASQEEARQLTQAVFESKSAALDAELEAADVLVGSFLSLVRVIQLQCEESDPPRSCYLIMENTCSKAETALWNRSFMKDLLLTFPNQPRAQGIAQGFIPKECAWLNTTFINYCTYGPEHPHKPTVIFTNLPHQALPDRKCTKSTCDNKRDKKPHVAVKNKKGPYERAQWPLEFVADALRACVEEIVRN